MKVKKIYLGAFLGLLMTSLVSVAAVTPTPTLSVLFSLYTSLQAQVLLLKANVAVLANKVAALQANVGSAPSGITVTSGSTVVGNYLGADGSNGFMVLFKNNSKNYLIEIAGGKYTLTNKTVYFDGNSPCSGNAYITSFSSIQPSNIVASIVFYSLDPIDGIATDDSRVLYGFGPAPAPEVIIRSEFFGGVCTAVSLVVLSDNLVSLSEVFDLQRDLPNPTVNFP